VSTDPCGQLGAWALAAAPAAKTTAARTAGTIRRAGVLSVFLSFIGLFLLAVADRWGAAREISDEDPAGREQDAASIAIFPSRTKAVKVTPTKSRGRERAGATPGMSLNYLEVWLMKRAILAAALACLGVTASGCAARMVSISNEKSAYAVRVSAFGSEMVYCSAQNPQQPICRKVTEQ
jgi:hypothetical protein